jgi:hypothetical protein
MFNLFDATKLTQWEQGKKLTNNHMTAGQKVLFSNSTGATAVMYAYDDGGIVKVNIPNELLQSAGKLIVDLDGSPSCRSRFDVNPADKPDNYTPVESDACTPPSIDPREVKNMYYTEPGKTAEKITSITWDGNTSGLVKTTLKNAGSGPTHYKVADLPDGWDADVVSNLNDLADSIKINGILLSEQEYMTPSESEEYNCWGARCADADGDWMATVTVVTQADTLAWTAQLTLNGFLKYPEPGIYFSTEVTSFECTEVVEIPEVVHTIDPKYLPYATIDPKYLPYATINVKYSMLEDGSDFDMDNIEVSTSLTIEEMYEHWMSGGLVRVVTYFPIDGNTTAVGAEVVNYIGMDSPNPEDGLIISTRNDSFIMLPDGTITFA